MTTKSLVISTVVLCSALLSVRAEMSGDLGRSRRFLGKLNPQGSQTNQCEFSIEIERVMFKLNSLKDKYKVVRIRVENTMSNPIRLSRDDDGVELDLRDGTTVRGTFNLQAQDSSLWDGLSEDMRKALAYPLSVRGVKGEDANQRRAEVIYVFAFFPADKVIEMPRAFRYTIQSVGKTIKIELPPATAA